MGRIIAGGHYWPRNEQWHGSQNAENGEIGPSAMVRVEDIEQVRL